MYQLVAKQLDTALEADQRKKEKLNERAHPHQEERTTHDLHTCTGHMTSKHMDIKSHDHINAYTPLS